MFIVFVAVTLFFHIQHSMAFSTSKAVVRYIMDEHTFFEVRDISFDKRKNRWSPENLPWYYDVAEKLPDGLRSAFINVACYYGKPYIDNRGKGSLRVRGIAVGEGLNPDTFHNFSMGLRLEQ
jgi:hypothetical protein